MRTSLLFSAGTCTPKSFLLILTSGFRFWVRMTEETFEYSLASSPAYLSILRYFEAASEIQPCGHSGTFGVGDMEQGQEMSSKEISQSRQGTVILCSITGKWIWMNPFNQIKIRVLRPEDRFFICRKWIRRWEILDRYSQTYAHFQLCKSKDRVYRFTCKQLNKWELKEPFINNVTKCENVKFQQTQCESQFH